MRPIKVIVVEDETVVRYALARLLGDEDDIDVAAEAGDGDQALTLARLHRPDVILMDLGIPRRDGLQVTREIMAELPDTAVVVLSVHHDDEHLFGAVKAGARGYVLKDAPPDLILRAVRAAAEGEGFLAPALVRRVMSEFARLTRLRTAARELFSSLTPREMQVLELIGNGLRNRDIAARLFISEKTVKNHVSSILAKLHVNDRIEAALLAEKHGLTEQ